MDNILYIYHHLGLGDHLMCNGLVRELIKNEKKAILFCKPHNIVSVNFMYKDCENLDFICAYDKDVINFYENNNIRIVKIGHKGYNFPGMPGFIPIENENNIIKIFYRQGGVDYIKRWDSWNVERNINNEKVLYEKFGLKDNDEYIFVHDDVNRNFIIKENNLPSNIKVIKPERSITDNIFDYCYLLENAKEIHCIDSTFRILVEHLNVKGKLYFHQYGKGILGWGIPMSRKDWITYVS